MIERFTSSIFKHCDSNGWVKHYVFEHGGKDTKPRRSEWGRLCDTNKMHDFIEWSRLRPGTVYCPPVGTFVDPSARTVEANVSEAPALVVELDDNPTEMRGLAEAILGPATLVIRSGGMTSTGEDKLHLYWRLTRPARTEAERQVLKAARAALGALCEADMTAVPLMHPMRWPGSWHTKGEPRLCEIIEQTENELDLDAAYAILNEVAPTPIRPVRADRQGEFKTVAPLAGEEVSRLLAKIPNAGLSWEQWNRLGMIVWDATHASDEGREAWHTWSALDARYDADVTDARWDHYFSSPPVDLAAGSLYHSAGEVMPRVADPAAAFDTPAIAPGMVVLPEPPLVTKSRDKGYRPRNGGIMLPEQQMDHFEGCVYVTALDKVLTPRGTRLTQSRFESVYGGHLFVISSDGQGTPSKSAWEAFIRNQRFFAPTADDMCFRPELEPLEIVDEGNLTLVNGYIPIETPRTEGDARPFLRHMEKLFPIERDRIILMSYMAFCLQNIGFKAQWWPVIQGAKGNGKTLFLNVMAYCIGEQYSHLPNTSKMTRSGINFNGWMRNKLFLGLDEIYSANRRDFLEEFKPYVTNRRLPIEAKGEDEFTGDNRANGIMLTNHKDGVPIDADERRYAPFFTRQQTAEDCASDGLTSEYFVDLWAWLRGEGHYAKYGQDYGFRIINWYLRQYVTSAEFDPAKLATRAPRTSSTEEAIKAGRGSIEQEIEDAIAEGRTGFAGPWVSGKALADLIDHSRIRVPKNKRRNLMQSIGYDWPKALPEGRPTSIVQPDGIRCVLYVKDGSPESKITNADDLCRRYTQAQIETKLGS